MRYDFTELLGTVQGSYITALSKFPYTKLEENLGDDLLQ